MGDAHYLSQSPLPEVPSGGGQAWLAEREAELLPTPYFHVVFTLPAPSRTSRIQNKSVIYDILFKASAETMITIAADPKHLGARIGIICRAAHLGLGIDASSACALHRAGRRAVTGR